MPDETYEQYQAKQYGLQSAPLYDTAFANEVKSAVDQKGGFLTLAEYIAIDQFGNTGFHNRNKNKREVHGATDVHSRWKDTIPVLLEKYGLSKVIEFGPGRGDLAVETLQVLKDHGKNVMWDFVEIDPISRSEIDFKMDKSGLKDNKGQIVSAIENFSGKSKALAVFAYSLDSIPPQCFVRTVEGKGPPDKVIGVTMEGNTLKEIYLSDAQLKQRGMKFENGVFDDGNGNTFDLNQWQMNKKGQRAYIPIQGYASLIRLSQMLEAGSAVLLVDELGPSPKSFETGHLFPPRFINKSFPQLNPKELYQQPGKELLYYPLSSNGLDGVMKEIGIRNIQCDTEERMALELRGKQFVQWRPGFGTDYRYAFIGNMENTPVIQNSIKIPAPYKSGHY